MTTDFRRRLLEYGWPPLNTEPPPKPSPTRIWVERLELAYKHPDISAAALADADLNRQTAWEGDR